MAGSHKRDTNARKPFFARATAPVAITASVVAIGVGMGTVGPTLVADEPKTDVVQLPQEAIEARMAGVENRDAILSRSLARPSKVELLLAATDKAIARAKTVRWTTDTMRRWTRPDAKAVQKGTIASGAKVLATGRSFKERVEVVVDGKAWWITQGYLTDTKPLAAVAGLSMKACPNPSVESGLTDNAVRVYRAVCNAFPQITSYGGWDNHGEHASGKAIDIMVSDVTLGTAIAEFLRTHSGDLNLYDVIWRQRIFMPMRAADGWRAMSDRGSVTANHYDHVHVASNS